MRNPLCEYGEIEGAAHRSVRRGHLDVLGAEAHVGREAEIREVDEKLARFCYSEELMSFKALHIGPSYQQGAAGRAAP